MCSDAQSISSKNLWNNDECNIILNYESKKGCPVFEYGILAKFFQKYSMFWGAIFIVFGLILSFLGNKFITVMVGVISSVAVFLSGVYLTTMIVDSSMKATNIYEYAVWIILAIWAILGILAGVLIAKNRKWGIAILGAFGGVMLGMLLTTIFIVGNDILYWGIIVGSGLVAFSITFFIETAVIIISTSFIGSYLVVRGISMYAGGFPNESELHTMAKNGYMDWNHFPKEFYGYLSGIIVLCILSSYFQWRHNKKKEDSIKYENL